MLKIVIKISLIIFSNLLAFLCVGFILDALFKTEGVAILASVVLSLPFLGLIMYFKAGKILEELNNISKK